MSVSTPAGDQRRPSVVSTGKKAPEGAAKSSSPAKSGSATARKSTSGGKGGGAGAGKGGGGKGRKPIAPVKVSQGRNWGPIGLFVAVGVIAVAIIGYGSYAAFQGSKSWEDRAAGIDGIVNFREQDPALAQGGQHVPGKVDYTVKPRLAASTTRTGKTAWVMCTTPRSPASTPCTAWSTARSG
ncbi:hypothetical protein Pflav_059280 [Phytohabitans flavus]|uniref:Uncharacterized protein n=1 Tax=Phytohabitans flavus TaxID=1076124 RepID=A0A6F8Y0L7_9ACTN|nr:hypothetical protein Pflav_059280 [Phytohabitans flavus]